MYIYTRIRDLREDEDKTQAKIAEDLGVGLTTYRRWETGEREIPLHIIIKLAKRYKVSLDYITGLTNNPEPSYKIKKQVNANVNVKTNKGNININ